MDDDDDDTQAQGDQQGQQRNTRQRAWYWRVLGWLFYCSGGILLWFAFWAMQHASLQQQLAMRSIVSALVFTCILFMVAINMPIMSSIWKSFSSTFVSKKRKAAAKRWLWINFFVAIILTALSSASQR